VNGARARFRAVIRTFGHHDRRPHAAPVRDQLQAQLLVPAIAFGLMVTTFLVPAMTGIQADPRRSAPAAGAGAGHRARLS
jgi:hypothetical protein